MSKNLQRHIPYRGPYIFDHDTGDFYIHYHQKCIGRAMDEQYMSSSDIAYLIMAQKEQAIEAGKTHYQQLFLENLSLSPHELKVLREAFDFDIDQLIQTIDETVQKNLNLMMDRNKIINYLELQKQSVKLGPDLLSSNTKKSLKAFNDILTNLHNIVQSLTINNEVRTGFLQLLTKCHYSKNMGIAQMGNKLYGETIKFERYYANQLQEFENKGLLKALLAIQTYAHTLSTQQTSSKKKTLTESNIVDVIDSMFEGGFSELVSSQIHFIANSAISDIGIARQTGTDPHDVQMTNADGVLTWMKGDTPRQGKMDFSFDNVKVTLHHQTLSNNVTEIRMNIGVSNKLYRSDGFAVTPTEIPTVTFDSGSGGTLKDAIDSTFKGDRLKYLVYNTLGHQEKMRAANFALNTILLNRQVVRIFASRGGVNDFAQYIFVNGRVISILQLLAYVSEHSVGKSRSLTERGGSQAVAITIADRPKMIAAGKIEDQYNRVKMTNQAINDATIAVHVHIKKLLNALPAQDLDKI